MDPITCCLLGICCPPAQRRKTLAAHFESMGTAPELSQVLADDLVTRFDALLSGNLVAAIAHAARQHKE